MFRGSFDHVLDEKGRVSLPKVFRDALAECRGEPSFVPLRQCLAIFPSEIYEELSSRLSAASSVVDSIQRGQRLIIGMSHPCPVDRAGRILVPTKLREWAGLKRDVVFMGVGNRIEIWDRVRHEADLRVMQDADAYAENMGALKEFGL
jgi:MraZ protein